MSNIKLSTRLVLVGAILVTVGAGLFLWGVNADLTPAQGLTRADMLRTIGQIAGGVGGVGVVVWLGALILRLRGR